MRVATPSPGTGRRAHTDREDGQVLPNRYEWCSLSLRQREPGSVEAVFNRMDQTTKKITSAQVCVMMGDLTNTQDRLELLLAAASVLMKQSVEEMAW